jgi:hypothetical protein
MNPGSMETRAAAQLLIGACGAILIGLLVGANAQTGLPDGPNRELVEAVCGSCHDVEMVRVNGRSEGAWNNTIDEMAGYGLRLSPADRALVLKYLATYLPPQ